MAAEWSSWVAGSVCVLEVVVHENGPEVNVKSNRRHADRVTTLFVASVFSGQAVRGGTIWAYEPTTSW